jgi:NAD(P)-dependent dehydrogenase (short-subunit alcohol dehydrogenase family)
VLSERFVILSTMQRPTTKYMDSLFDVSDEIVVITGAAGNLGCAYAQAFLDRGAKVVGLDLSVSSKVKEQQKNSNYLFSVTDVTSKQSLQQALLAIETIFGTPTVLVNNAAIDSPPSAPMEENGPFETYPESSWDNVLNVNLKGVFLCCQVFGTAMAKKKKGSIVNISSIYGVVSPDQSLYQYRRDRGEVFYKPVAYSASKSGIMNLTRYLAVYWAKHSVRVNTLTIAGVFNNQDEIFLNAYCSRIPVGRMANMQEYCGSVLFMASKASSYMTGSNLVIDGGWTSI